MKKSRTQSGRNVVRLEFERENRLPYEEWIAKLKVSRVNPAFVGKPYSRTAYTGTSMDPWVRTETGNRMPSDYEYTGS